MAQHVLPFHKMEGVGNDFVLIEAEAAQGLDYSDLARRLCHRPFGIGADGLLVIERGVRAPVRMRMFNPDGTEDFCGNGLRCAARYAFEQGFVDTPAFAIETLGERLVPVQIHLHEGSVEAISTQLPPPRFHPREIPALADGAFIEDYPLTVAGRTVRIACVNTGTTHTVIFGATLPDDALFREVSPRIGDAPDVPRAHERVVGGGRFSRRDSRAHLGARGGRDAGLWQRRGGSGGTGAPCRLGRRGG
jgi:diaminopimelate epimerase